MNTEDWAVVVGINSYPELDKLDGPENDATAFHEWLTSAGDVPPAQATLILSRHFPPAKAATDALPTVEALKKEFYRLDDIAIANGRTDGEERVGRRLYLFLAGHGFGPDLDGACLLMANATRGRTENHIPGKSWANHFVLSGYFDEVLLFMDCCRESYRRAILNIPDEILSRDADEGRRFYAFSAKYAKLSRERLIDGKVQGVFSAALLKGLEAGAAKPDGTVTAASLSSYLFNSMRNFLSPEDLRNPDVAKEPDIYVDPLVEADAFVITTVASKTFRVTLELPPGSAGRTVQILGAGFAPVHSALAPGDIVEFDLLRGRYLAQVAGTTNQQVVEVDGSGDVTVNLETGARHVGV